MDERTVNKTIRLPFYMYFKPNMTPIGLEYTARFTDCEMFLNKIAKLIKEVQEEAYTEGLKHGKELAGGEHE